MDARPVTTIVIGAGHAGLASSRCLSERSIDHVVLERGEVANAWRTERWDSLRLLTPNWQSALPGYRYEGDDPDGFMSMPEIASFIDSYACHIEAPVLTGTTVTSVCRHIGGYLVHTNRGTWQCRSIVLASGACNKPSVPTMASAVPTSVNTLTPMNYRNPDQLAQGGVLIVGASATGLQLAQEIQRSGRQVTLAIGEHVRMPRQYRGRDIQWWMDQAGILDQRIEDETDIARARRLPSPQLIGTPERSTLDVNTLIAEGVSVTGRLAGIRDNKALFSGSLSNCCALADLRLGRLLNIFDNWATHNAADVDGAERYAPTQLSSRAPLSIDLSGGQIRTVIWATGYRADYSWLHVPVLDRKGKLQHDRGIVGITEPGSNNSASPGLYAMGLSYMRRRKSSFIYGAASDAQEITAHLSDYLDAQVRKQRSSMVVPAPMTNKQHYQSTHVGQ